MPLSSRFRRHGALLIALALTAAACGGGGDGDDEGASATTGAPRAEGEPAPGGRAVYGLEAESTGGYCLPNAQLAVSGAQVAVSIYDPLVWPDEDNRYQPYLAEDITSNAEATEWTITLREGVTFHDGTPLDAEAVKLNLDTYRGKGPVPAPLFSFVFADIADVAVVDPLTVKVTTTRPWAALRSALFGGLGRVGMVAPAQLNDAENCARKLIGTGPYSLKEWVPNDHLTVVKNPDYWRDGLPYLDEIEFRPIGDGPQRLNALQAGQLDIIHASSGNEIDQLERLKGAGTIDLRLSDQSAEVGYTMLNVSKPPFDDVRARRAMAYGVDRGEINDIINKGKFTLTKGPFADNVLGYVADTGYPSYDPDRAKELLADYEAEKGELRFTLLTITDPTSVRTAQLIQAALKKIGVEVELKQTTQSQQISQALAGDFQATQWRNHPGGDPDTQYVWWHSGSPVNFGRIDDPEIDRLLDTGRTTTDRAAREQIYQDLARRFGSEVYNVWTWYVKWGIGTRPDVRGVAGPELPGGGTPIPVLAGLHQTVGLWRSK